jgi:hypothetical protein
MAEAAKTETNHAIENARGWYDEIVEMMTELDVAVQEDDDSKREEIVQRIQEGPLSVLVRDGWRAPGSASDDGAEEYEILLSTGGPALRVYGTLGKYGEPDTAELQWQDWGTPWTTVRFFSYERAPLAGIKPVLEATLLDFARQFYFGA